MNTEDTEKIKLPKVLRATKAIFLGIVFGVHYSTSSENEDNTYKDTVYVPGIPFLTCYINALALETHLNQPVWEGDIGKIGFIIVGLILQGLFWLSTIGIAYNMIALFIGLPFALLNKFSNLRRFR
jgi:hypothetical protein